MNKIKSLLIPVAIDKSIVLEVVFGGSVGCKLDIVDIVDDVCSFVGGFVDDVDAVVDVS